MTMDEECAAVSAMESIDEDYNLELFHSSKIIYKDDDEDVDDDEEEEEEAVPITKYKKPKTSKLSKLLLNRNKGGKKQRK
jgi:hypothetical protein